VEAGAWVLLDEESPPSGESGGRLQNVGLTPASSQAERKFVVSLKVKGTSRTVASLGFGRRLSSERYVELERVVGANSDDKVDGHRLARRKHAVSHVR
jgi:hypothetical protein